MEIDEGWSFSIRRRKFPLLKITVNLLGHSFTINIRFQYPLFTSSYYRGIIKAIVFAEIHIFHLTTTSHIFVFHCTIFIGLFFLKQQQNVYVRETSKIVHIFQNIIFSLLKLRRKVKEKNQVINISVEWMFPLWCNTKNEASFFSTNYVCLKTVHNVIYLSVNSWLRNKK